MSLPLDIETCLTSDSEHHLLKGLEALLHWSAMERVSDLHLEPQGTSMRIRLRIDGQLSTQAHVNTRHAPMLISRLKMLAHLDIAEKRLPQDGRFEIRSTATHIHARLSTCPTRWGEKAVIRLLNLDHTVFELTHLGLTPGQLTAMQQVLGSPQGLIIITGPTGSGKTMTLYSLLHLLNTEQRNIISVEDPIEMVMPGINQIQIQEKAGIDFPSILRHLLRQDPDVLMIGEIRDSKTAEIALKATQTGHLVLSTLHTQSAAQALSRLEQLGIPPYLVAESVKMILAQRLVRRLCQACGGAGCIACHVGFSGRVGIFEVLCARQHGAALSLIDGLDLAAAGRLKVQSGITSAAEIMRVC